MAGIPQGSSQLSAVSFQQNLGKEPYKELNFFLSCLADR